MNANEQINLFIPSSEITSQDGIWTWSSLISSSLRVGASILHASHLLWDNSVVMYVKVS